MRLGPAVLSRWALYRLRSTWRAGTEPCSQTERCPSGRRRQAPLHGRAGGGAVHSINSRHSLAYMPPTQSNSDDPDDTKPEKRERNHGQVHVGNDDPPAVLLVEAF